MLFCTLSTNLLNRFKLVGTFLVRPFSCSVPGCWGGWRGMVITSLLRRHLRRLRGSWRLSSCTERRLQKGRNTKPFVKLQGKRWDSLWVTPWETCLWNSWDEHHRCGSYWLGSGNDVNVIVFSNSNSRKELRDWEEGSWVLIKSEGAEITDWGAQHVEQKLLLPWFRTHHNRHRFPDKFYFLNSLALWKLKGLILYIL